MIAAVEGVATAAGCQLVAACDLAIAGADARFALPGVSIGLFCSTPLVAVGRAVSRKHAMEMALTGDLYDAADGRALRPGQSRRRGGRGARRGAARWRPSIAARSAATLAIGKRAFYRQIDLPLAEAYALAAARDGRQSSASRLPPKAPPHFSTSGRRTGGTREPRFLFRRLHSRHPDQREDDRHGRRFGQSGAAVFGVLKYLSERGFAMLPINPGLAGQAIHGLTVYAEPRRRAAADRHGRRLPPLRRGGRGGRRRRWRCRRRQR